MNPSTALFITFLLKLLKHVLKLNINADYSAKL